MVYSLVKAKDKKLLKSKYALQARVLRLSPRVQQILPRRPLSDVEVHPLPWGQDFRGVCGKRAN